MGEIIRNDTDWSLVDKKWLPKKGTLHTVKKEEGLFTKAETMMVGFIA